MAMPGPSPSAETGLPPGVEVGRLGARFVAFLIDSALPAVVGGALGALLPTMSGSLRVVAGVVGAVLVLAWGIVVWFMLATRAASPGMRVMKLQLVGFYDGRPIGWGRVILRTVVLRGLGVTGIGLVIMLILMLLHPRRQGWHDLVAKAVVIAERKLAPTAPTSAQALAPPPGMAVSQPAPDARSQPAEPIRAAPGPQAPYGGPGQPAGPVGATPGSQPYTPQPYQPQASRPLPYAPQPYAPQTYPPQTYPPGVFPSGTPGARGPLPPPMPTPAPTPAPTPGAAPAQPLPGSTPGIWSNPTAPPSALTSPSSPPYAATSPASAFPGSADSAGDRTNLSPAAPPAQTGPEWLLVLDDGRLISLDGMVLLGRNPQPQPGDEDAQLIKIADESRTVSKSHLAVSRDDQGVFVTDLGSTNGSTVTTTNGVSTRCRPGERVHVDDGSIVSIGDHWLEIRTSG